MSNTPKGVDVCGGKRRAEIHHHWGGQSMCETANEGKRVDVVTREQKKLTVSRAQEPL